MLSEVEYSRQCSKAVAEPEKNHMLLELQTALLCVLLFCIGQNLANLKGQVQKRPVACAAVAYSHRDFCLGWEVMSLLCRG